MHIIPVINCNSSKCVKEKLEALTHFSPRVTHIHIDVGEKPVSSTRIALYSRALMPYAKRFLIALHCMVPEKKFFSNTHINSGARLVYYHAREIKNFHRFEAKAHEWKRKGVDVGVVFRVDDAIHTTKIPKGVRHVLVLAVHPGPAGQVFNPNAIKLISFLRKSYPRVILTVDGGITPAVVKKLLRADVHAVTSSAYIWNSANPQKRYQELMYHSKAKSQNAKVQAKTKK